MRNVVRVLLAVAIVAVGTQVSWAQTFRGADSKVTGNFRGIWSTTPRTYRSYSYVAPQAAVVTAPAVVAAPAVVNAAPRATTVAPAPAPVPAPAVVAAPPVRMQAQAPVRTYRTYSYQPSNQGGLPAYYFNGGFRSSQVNGYNPAFRRADAKIFGR